MFNIAFPHQFTPLHWAALNGHVEIVQVLINKGTDTNIKDDDGVRG